MLALKAVFIFGLAAVSALPAVDPSAKVDGVTREPRYNPDAQNVYHLFTRQNPSLSQPIISGSAGLLGMTNYNAQRSTVVLLHGWLESATSDFNTVLVPAFLAAADVNVIVVDWNAGAGTVNYAAAVSNTLSSGESVARFLNWLIRTTEVTASNFHIVGHSLGGHQAGIVGRNVEGDIAYISALDPAFPGFVTNDHRLREDDSAYTEVIHTNAGLLGFLTPLGHVDFYPNGGINMPGCNSQQCDHLRAIFYMAESLTSGGFRGRRCASYVTAMTGNCILLGRLNMGGIRAKTGSSGIYYLETNASPPFSSIDM